MLSEIGLIVIALAWIVQLIYSWKGKKEIRKEFILLYMLGVLFLLAGIYVSSSSISYYELATFFAAAILLIKISSKK